MATIKQVIQFLSQFPEHAEVNFCSGDGLVTSFVCKEINILYHYDFNEHFEWFGGSETLIIGQMLDD